ncbi:LysM peptidoglycan-binding domain-containing protein [uncultured Roseobacter sp.]|uniref:LysM peptidoglycan-binding domain-containing protein n=1 Tax=uncultured Roseobacter sp. TaxID=114847 RepID=UPI0026111221|nr:LysM peptidoglycan-binding domain-containing protein [uncultured Roseobacter sp.]
MSDKGGAVVQGGSGLLTAGIVIAVVIAAGTYLGLRDDAEPTQEDLAALVAPGTAPEGVAQTPPADASQAPDDAGAQAEPEAPVAVAPEPEPETAADSAPAIVPTVDEVRVDADGLMVVAGRAAPGARIRVLVGGDEVAQATADAGGAFAAVASLAPSDTARLLTLESILDGVVTASADDIILAPIAAPVVTAEAPVPQDDPAPATGTGAAADTEAVAEEETTEVAEAVTEAATDLADEGLALAEEAAEAVTESVEEAADAATAAVAGLTEPAAESSVTAPEEAAGDAVAAASVQVVDAPVESAPSVPEAPEVIAEAPQSGAPAETPVESAESAPEAAPVVEETVAAGTTVTREDVAEAPAAVTEIPAEAVATGTQEPETAAAAETAGAADAEAVEDAPADQQIAVLRSTQEGVALVQPAPQAPRRVVLDTIGYSESGVVQLAGRASAEAASVRVYLDNTPVLTLPVAGNGTWRGDVPGVAPGVYTLRIDALDEGGDVTSRLETPFKREAPAVLAEASQGESGPVRAVTVQTGDTLWAIARERYGEGLLYVRVFEANRTAIRDPDLIYPGQIFDLPDDG